MSSIPLRLLLAAVLLVVTGLCLPRAAYAADPVVCSASIDAISFGTVDPSTAGNVDVKGSLSWTCTNNTDTNYNATACFNIGNGPLGLDANNYRQMAGPGGNISFQIYLDSGRTQVWGSVTTAAFPVPAEADFQIKKNRTETGTIPVYLRLFGNQPAVTAGTYNTVFFAPQVRITGELTKLGFGSCSVTGNSDAGNFAPMSISANVAPACTVTATNLDFGTIAGFLTSNFDSTSTLQVTCVANTPYKVGLDNGLHFASGSRRMQGSGGQIAYSLYRNSGRTQTWGSTLGVDTVSDTGTGSPQSIAVYGRVPPQTTPSAGSYQDTVTVSVTY